MKKVLQSYTEMGKEIRLLARVTTLGADRYVITIAKEDNKAIEPLKGKRVFITLKEATNE